MEKELHPNINELCVWLNMLHELLGFDIHLCRLMCTYDAHTWCTHDVHTWCTHMMYTHEVHMMYTHEVHMMNTHDVHIWCTLVVYTWCTLVCTWCTFVVYIWCTHMYLPCSILCHYNTLVKELTVSWDIEVTDLTHEHYIPHSLFLFLPFILHVSEEIYSQVTCDVGCKTQDRKLERKDR